MSRLSLLRPVSLSPGGLRCRASQARIWTSFSLSTQCLPRARPNSTLSNTPEASPQRRLPKLLLAGTLAAALTFYLLQDSRPKTLNSTTFAPYTVTSKIPVSPTSFILSLRPQHPSALPYLTPSGSWWPFQWSVQVKQPEIQIQREYTPLPPDPDAGDEDGTLRFYVRRVAGGEVSNYLGRMEEGDTVEVRLGERGFAFNYLDACEENDIVCLAGGTGLATAMQVAHAVLRDPAPVRPNTRVRILWAVRRRSDIQANPTRGPKLRSLEDGLDEPTPIARELLAMKSRYGDSLDVRVAVDEEGTAFGERELKDVLALTGRPRRGTPPRYPAALPAPIAAACDENAPAVPEKVPAGTTPATLRRPIFVCGPEGFVDAYVGRLERDSAGRFWRSGGLLGELNARYGNGETWLVLGFP